MYNCMFRTIATWTFICLVSFGFSACSDSATPTSPEPIALVGSQLGTGSALSLNGNCDPTIQGTNCNQANNANNVNSANGYNGTNNCDPANNAHNWNNGNNGNNNCDPALQGSDCDPANNGYNWNNGNNENNAGNGIGTGTQGTTEEVMAAMALAIQDEYHAENVYLRVLADFGNVFPFSRIVHAEQRHSAAIAHLYGNRRLDAPDSEWTLDNVPRFGSIQEACAAAAQAEIDNIALYDSYLDLELPADVRNVFTNNRAASLNNHLPAFEACR